MKSMFAMTPVEGVPMTVKWQKSTSNLLSAAGYTQYVYLYDRNGAMFEMINLERPCISFDWERTGTSLAILEDRSNFVLIWDSHSRSSRRIDFGLKDSGVVLSYSKTNGMLAVGTAKGNLILIDRNAVSPLIGRHYKAVTMVAWSSKDNLVATYGDDHRVIVTDTSSNPIFSIDVKHELTQLDFDQICSKALEGRGMPAWRYVTAVGRGKTLVIMDTQSQDQSRVDMNFKPDYGAISTYVRYNENYCLLGFANGILVGQSLGSEDGQDPTCFQELFVGKEFGSAITCLAVAPNCGRVACAGESSIKIHSMRNVSYIINVLDVPEGHNKMASLGWSADEQLLAVSLKTGEVIVYLAQLPVVGACYGDAAVYLSNLRELSLKFAPDVDAIPSQVLGETQILAMGPYHIAAVANSSVTFYSVTEQGLDSLCVTELSSTITSACIGEDYAALLMESGKLQLIMIDSDGSGREREQVQFPKKGVKESITCCDMKAGFLVYGATSGEISAFFVEDWSNVYEYTHKSAITQLYLSPCGLNVCFVDAESSVHCLKMTTDTCLTVKTSADTRATGIVSITWETMEQHQDTFVVWDQKSKGTTHIVNFNTIREPDIMSLDEVHTLPSSYVPLRLHDGVVMCLSDMNKITYERLESHSLLNPSFADTSDPALMEKIMERALTLNRLDDAWNVAVRLDSNNGYERVAWAAMVMMDLDMALRCYRRVKSPHRVMALEKLQLVDDIQSLKGFLLVQLQEIDPAQMFFLKSSYPLEALELRKDLGHWDQALQLAKTLAPEQVPLVSREVARDMELRADYANALYHYERSLTKNTEQREHNEKCRSGIARTALRLGEIRKGTSMANEVGDAKLYKECASILEGMKLFAEAALFYEQAEVWEKSVTFYLRAKNWSKATSLIDRVSSAKVQSLYAKAMHANSQYKPAAKAYIKAKDYVAAIRVYLDDLNDPESAVRIVPDASSTEAASLVAKYFLKLDEYGSAIHFLIISKRTEEAFQLAKKHNQMEEFADIIGNDGSKEEYRGIAQHFQTRGKPVQAGKFWKLAEDYQNALQQYFTAPLDQLDEAVEGTIDVASKSKSDHVLKQVISYLMGEKDQQPKDARYLFKLYMALEQYNDAAHTAIIIAREDQSSGNYRVAHDMLYRMSNELKEHGIKPKADMSEELLILHSYMMAKYFVKQGNHLMASFLLSRVANNISRFPAHTVQILTSTVVESFRAGRRNTAFNIAIMLMKPEYRSQIDAKYKEKIERMVRRPDKSEVDEPATPCPYCKSDVEMMRLDCAHCKNLLPYCIVTGRHMLAEDWSECPSCKFPALYSEFIKVLSSTGDSTPCFMCGAGLEPDSISLVDDPSERLQEMTAK
ncbi:WD repeat-containing protein 19-like [Sycon ciliatum]|uniref:WD repeat-containing protein 19-like n=1 Tax=Sycon ciliatum TaxID=27933 RepID=UPI0031F6AC8E